MKIHKLVKHDAMPKGYYFFSALFNCFDGIVNMILYPFNRSINISSSYQEWAYKKQKNYFMFKSQ